jgi:hypothetical protein
MSHRSEARNIVRSYLPESRLIEQRDAPALTYKYFARQFGVGVRPEMLLSPSAWVAKRTGDLRYQRKKQLGNVYVEARHRLPLSAYDSEQGVGFGYRGRSQAIMLHVSTIDGVQHLRQQLGLAAAYIQEHESLRTRPLVVGTTYRELANVAIRFGFRDAQVTRCDPDYRDSIQVMHKTFCAVNGVQRPFKLAAVYMPTTAFVQRFGAPSPGTVPRQ